LVYQGDCLFWAGVVGDGLGKGLIAVTYFDCGVTLGRQVEPGLEPGFSEGYPEQEPPELGGCVDMEFAGGEAAEEGEEDGLHHIFAIDSAHEFPREVLLGDTGQAFRVQVEEGVGRLRVAVAQALHEGRYQVRFGHDDTSTVMDAAQPIIGTDDTV